MILNAFLTMIRFANSEIVQLKELKWRYFTLATSVTPARILPAALGTSSVTIDGRVVTVNTSSAHEYFAGMLVTLAGFTGASAVLNAKWPVESIVDADSFTVKLPDHRINGNDLPTAIAGTPTTTFRPMAQRVWFTNTDAQAINVGPNAGALGLVVPATSGSVELPQMPEGSKFYLGDWYCAAASGTPTLKVLYV